MTSEFKHVHTNRFEPLAKVWRFLILHFHHPNKGDEEFLCERCYSIDNMVVGRRLQKVELQLEQMMK